ncbi:MAG: hypothetical protein Satyrvirus36_1, partial [Satyrvirus sp.]
DAEENIYRELREKTSPLSEKIMDKIKLYSHGNYTEYLLGTAEYTLENGDLPEHTQNYFRILCTSIHTSDEILITSWFDISEKMTEAYDSKYLRLGPIYAQPPPYSRYGLVIRYTPYRF